MQISFWERITLVWNPAVEKLPRLKLPQISKVEPGWKIHLSLFPVESKEQILPKVLIPPETSIAFWNKALSSVTFNEWVLILLWNKEYYTIAFLGWRTNT